VVQWLAQSYSRTYAHTGDESSGTSVFDNFLYIRALIIKQKYIIRFNINHKVLGS